LARRALSRSGLLGKQAAVVSLRNDIDLTLSGTAARTTRRPSLSLLSHRVGLSKATLLRLQEMLAAQDEPSSPPGRWPPRWVSNSAPPGGC
jgi:hypothetical protein